MDEFLKDIFGQISPAMGYLVLFISAFVENTFPPIPGDTVTVLGAYLITTGFMGFWGVYLATTFGSVAGFFSMYFLGLRFGRTFIKSKLKQRLFKDEQIHKVEVWFSKYGYGIIAANRFLSGTRSVISLFAGLFHLCWWKVLLLATASALIWNGLLIYAGYQLGVNWQNITGIISNYNQIIIALTLLLVIYIAFKKYRKKRAEKDK